MNESVSFFAFEREKTRLERTNRRIFFFALILLALVVATNAFWVLRFADEEDMVMQMNIFEMQTVERLRNLRSDEAAIRRLREQLEAENVFLRAYQTDRIAVQKGMTGSAVEDAVVRRDQLQARLYRTETNVRVLSEALQELSENERLCLEKFFVVGGRGAVARLECELPYSPAQLYRIRDHAIKNLTALLYGHA